MARCIPQMPNGPHKSNTKGTCSCDSSPISLLRFLVNNLPIKSSPNLEHSFRTVWYKIHSTTCDPSTQFESLVLLLKPIWPYLLSVFQAWYEFKFTMLNLGKHWKSKCIIATNVNVHTKARALPILPKINFFFLANHLQSRKVHFSPRSYFPHSPSMMLN